MKTKRVMTGMKPTGDMLHLGNLLGALIPLQKKVETQKSDNYIFVADLHALTSVRDGDKLKKQTFEIAVDYMSVLGTEGITFYKQSDIVQLPKLSWMLANFTPYSLMLRAHSFKDAQNNQKKKIKHDQELIEMEQSVNHLTDDDPLILSLKENIRQAKSIVPINMGSFTYPILMAADILGYDFDEIPVGKDQKQHVEMARDIARYVNKHYQADIFVEPKEVIETSVMTIPGIDGRKMSKSYDNFIGVFEEGNALKKKVMAIETDSKGLEDKKDPDTCNIFALIQLFSPGARADAIASKYRAGGYGYGHAKQELLEILNEYLTPYREKRKYFYDNPHEVEKLLDEGAQKMNTKLDEVMARFEKYIGV